MDVILLDLIEAGIEGECQLKGYEGWIELLSFSHGVAQQITGDADNTKGTSIKPSRADFTVTKYVDSTSRALIALCDQATVIPALRVMVDKNDQRMVTKTFVYSLDKAVIISFSSGSGGGVRGQETITFDYAKISWEYVAQKDESGDPGSEWELPNNSGK